MSGRLERYTGRAQSIEPMTLHDDQARKIRHIVETRPAALSPEERSRFDQLLRLHQAGSPVLKGDFNFVMGVLGRFSPKHQRGKR